MTDREMKKLSRAELLEMLLMQSREVARLRKELEEAKVQLEDRRIRLAESGNIAEAALRLSGVFETAQEASERYLAEIETMRNETQARCRIIEEQTRCNCEALMRAAREEAEAYWDAARTKIQNEQLEQESWQEILDLLEDKPAGRCKGKE